MSRWSYPAPYDTYDVGGDDAAEMLTPDARYWSVRRDDELIAYACLGEGARVPGLGAEPGIDDLGFGLRPHLMGHGLSREIFPWLLPELADEIRGATLRVVILVWNQRSLAAYRRVGFSDAGTHTVGEEHYLLLTRSVGDLR